MQPQCVSCPFLHRFALFNLQNSTTKIGPDRGTHNEEGHKAGGVRKGAGRKKRMQSVESQNLGSFLMKQIGLALQKHEKFGITHIPDVIQIKCNFNGQVDDPRTTEE